METRFHPLPSPVLGTQRTLVSLHFGTGLRGPKMYLQAGLHANEMPGLLVMNVLQERLLALEKDHQLCGEVALVPVANPIGLGQIVVGSHIGRFELCSSENFNRGFPQLADYVIEALGPSFAGDAASRIHTARARLRQAIEARRVAETQELQAMRLTLLALAPDADVVLDLHCDREAVMHVYTHDDMLADGRALSDRLGAHALFYNDSEPGGRLRRHVGADMGEAACGVVGAYGACRTDLRRHGGIPRTA
ncbi:succinylglutamate desuccinylase/aspartoacylase family protein [Paraburkholderia sediminicola]|uniref:succinylglutamate desuccinylase/aspartoacylase domain-containing protein n=1 Tax=Paraburkholderia sediminicola TaxID=458836 RepID=UPI0038B9A966